MLPSKTFATQEETSVPGYNKGKERIPIMAYSDASGSLKLKPILIEKSRSPKTFKNVSQAYLFIYKSKITWMDSTVKFFFEICFCC